MFLTLWEILEEIFLLQIAIEETEVDNDANG